MAKKYVVTYSRDEDGWWVAEAKSVSAATQGRTIEQARERVREAIAAAVDVDAADVVLGDQIIHLPADQRKALKLVTVTKAKAQKHHEAAEKAVVAAARKLTKSGLSLRDAGEILGLTRQRIHQLIGGAQR